MAKPARGVDTAQDGGLLVKENLARALKESIFQGKLAPGQRVVEGKWARHFGVAQASVREAINLLIAEGFLTKDSGRSARVALYTEEDVARIYEVRAALEGMAARLAAERKADLAPMQRAIARMVVAIKKRDMPALIESDLTFHLALCEASANPLLLELARRVLAPLFAFVEMRVLQSRQGPQSWFADLPVHKRMVELIREGDPFIAGHYVQRALQHFVSSAYSVWGNVDGALDAGARRGRKSVGGP